MLLHVLDQDQKAVVVEPLAEDRQQDRVVDVIEASFDISFDEPFRTLPTIVDGLQGGPAAAIRSEAVRGRAELRLAVCFQDGTHDFLQQFVLPDWDAERA